MAPFGFPSKSPPKEQDPRPFASLAPTRPCVDGLSGIDLVQEMRARNGKVSVILITVHGDVDGGRRDQAWRVRLHREVVPRRAPSSIGAVPAMVAKRGALDDCT